MERRVVVSVVKQNGFEARSELSMNRRHSLGLQVIPIASNRPATLLQKHSSSCQLKKLENVS